MPQETIAARFRGPAGIGNGGYIAGRMATHLGTQPAEVTLRRGWPLDATIAIAREGAAVQARDAKGQVVAEARAAQLDLVPPPAPTRAEAEAATRWFLDSPFSHSTGMCFVCGSAWPEGVGLRIFTGRVEGRPGIAAALWRPDAAFAGADGRVLPEFLWAALDCGGAFAFTVGAAPQAMLLGRITARIDGTVERGEPCVVMGWQAGQDGRKRMAGTAVLGADGGLRAVARSVWFVPAPVAS